MIRSEQIQQLSHQEKLELMDALWVALQNEVDDIASPAWHNEVLKHRREQIESGKAEFITVEDARSMLNEYAVSD